MEQVPKPKLEVGQTFSLSDLQPGMEFSVAEDESERKFRKAQLISKQYFPTSYEDGAGPVFPITKSGLRKHVMNVHIEEGAPDIWHTMEPNTQIIIRSLTAQHHSPVYDDMN